NASSDACQGVNGPGRGLIDCRQHGVAFSCGLGVTLRQVAARDFPCGLPWKEALGQSLVLRRLQPWIDVGHMPLAIEGDFGSLVKTPRNSIANLRQEIETLPLM